MRNRRLLGLVGCLSALVLLACMGFAAPLQLALLLPFGWVLYLRRVGPEVVISWQGVATAVVCLALITGGLHAFLRWLATAPDPMGERPSGGLGDTSAWPLRRTAALVAVVVLMFAAGIATVGVAHQVGWLIASGEPLMGSASRAARRAASANNLKQIALGFHNYASAHDDHLPPGATFDAAGRPLHGWLTLLDHYIEPRKGPDPIDLSVPWDDPRNAGAFRQDRSVYRNPMIPERVDSRGYALTHYAANGRVIGGDTARAIASITDGTSNTILAGEVAADFKPWGHPIHWRDPARGINRSPDGFGGPFPGGANVLFADGSVRFLRDNINPRTLGAIATPDGGEPVSPDAW